MEKSDTLKMAKELQKQFEEQGFDIVMSRTSDVYVSTDARTKLERDNKCDLAISVHRNSASSSSAQGFEVWVHTKAPQSYINWCKDIVSGMASCGMRIRNGRSANYVCDGVYRGYIGSVNDNYYVNSGTNAPSSMLEVGFVGNAADNALFDSKLSELCEAVVRASCKFLGKAYREPEKENPSVGTGTLYCVQAGAFSVRENAERLAKELKEKGYQAYIWVK